MRRAIQTAGLLAIVACCVGFSQDALSAGAAKPAKTAVKAGPTWTAASMAKLKSGDVTLVQSGLEDARLAGKRAAAAGPQIAALLRSGLPYPVAEAAIDALAEVESPDIAAVIPYARHRDLKVRRAAIRALARTGSAAGIPLAASTLRVALSDPDGAVRAGAATGLGSLKAKTAVPDLLMALDRHVYEAAVSIGQLCDMAECAAFAARLGKVPFDVITTGLDQILFRPAAEVSDDVKVSLVGRVRDMGTRDANKFLRDVQGRWAKNGSAKVKLELDAGVQATMSSPGSDP